MDKVHQIYFLQRVDGLIKIGTTSDFPSRLSALAVGHGALAVLRVINGGRKREREIHSAFKRFHEYGEWFRPERGALPALIDQLEEGPELAVGSSEAKTDWDIGEADLMEDARRKIGLMVKARMDRSLIKREAALKAITEEHGFSPWFLWHAQKRGATISAYGYRKVSDAYVSELRALLDQLTGEIVRYGGNQDLADRLRAMATEIETRRALR